MNNEARSAEVVNYQGSGAAKLRRDLTCKKGMAGSHAIQNVPLDINAFYM